MDKNELARIRFGSSYDSLSAFGQSEIDRELTPDLTPYRTVESEQPPLRVADVLEENRRLKQAVEDLQDENADLWNENQELRIASNRWEDEGGLHT
jgi:hypothetical protein